MNDSDSTEDKLRSLTIGSKDQNGRRYSRKTHGIPVLWLSICVATGLISFYFGLRYNLEEASPQLVQKPPQLTIQSEEELPEEEVNTIRVSGFIYPNRQSTVSSQITGRVDEILVNEGDFVQRGQTLAILDNNLAVSSVQESEVNLKVAEANSIAIRTELQLAEKNLEKIGTLEADGYVSELELTTSLNRIEVLQATLNASTFGEEAVSAKLEAARENLRLHSIKSPFDGIVVSVDAQAGEVISPFSAGGGFTRTGICTIVDITDPFIKIEVPESLSGSIQTNGKVDIIIPSNPSHSYNGTVSHIMPIADRSRASVSVRVEFESIDEYVIPGVSVDVHFKPQRM